jgi:uncharacterized protein YndB with AHSA1/START domain
MAPASGDQATVVVTVEVTPAEAFRIFTEEIDLWWRRGKRFRNAGSDHGLICIEPGVGGRVFESFGADGGGQTVVEIGRTLAWEPPHRLLFEWRNANFAPNEKTEVEVRFDPSISGTRVTLVHRGYGTLRADHPVRHGLQGAEFARMLGRWWGDLMTSFRIRAG